jgi:hypothetical protein
MLADVQRKSELKILWKLFLKNRNISDVVSQIMRFMVHISN